MNRTEEAMIRTAIAEAIAEHEIDPSEDRRHVLQGMRYIAGLLGMPEGHTHYVWPQPPGADRLTRRRAFLNYYRRDRP